VFSPAILAVAVTVKTRAAFPAVFPLCEPPAFFLVTTGVRISRSAILLSLSGYRHNDNYPDVAVMPKSGLGGGVSAGRGGGLAA
jgi:hypothetical protein